jgi:L-amino acid N-acyltransferase YncA
VKIRRATVGDAESIAAILNGVIAEGNLTVFERPFSAEEEREFISSLGARSVLHVAEVGGKCAGVQSVDLFSPWIASLTHVATMGTWVAPEARGRGLGRALFKESLSFARSNGYSKIVVQVLANNDRALRFYRGQGFTDIGVFKNHAKLSGVFHDEVYLEVLLD